MTDVKAASTRGTIVATYGQATTTDRRQAAIQAALQKALHILQQPHANPTEHAAKLWNATARTRRAFTLLKTAGAELRQQIDRGQEGAQ